MSGKFVGQRTVPCPNRSSKEFMKKGYHILHKSRTENRPLSQTLSQKGFSLAELLMTVAILVITLAIGIPAVLSIQRNLRQKELDAKAEIIYTAVQNKLSKMRAGGNTSIYQYSSDESNAVFQLADIPGDADEDTDHIEQGDICYFTSESLRIEDVTAASVIMDQDTVDESLLNHHWVIEYNPKSASVYAVFYSEDKANCAQEYIADFQKYDYKMRYKDNRLEDGARVGYYGGGSAAASSTLTTMTPSLKITNAEKLVADISCTLPSAVSDFPVFKVELEDTVGNKYTKYYAFWASDAEYRKEIAKEAGSCEIDYSDSSMKKSGRTFYLELVLDDLSEQATRFDNLYGAGSSNSVKLESGTPLKITVTAMCPGNHRFTQNLSDTEVTNSLFADQNSRDSSAGNKTPELNMQYGSEEYPAVINCGRHLQNLDENSGVTEKVKYAVQSSDITFSDSANQVDLYDWYETYSGKFYNGIVNGQPNFLPISNSNLAFYSGALGTKSYRILNLTENTSEDAGLFSSLGDNQTVKDVILTGTSARTTGNSMAAGALVGRVTGNASINHCQVFLTMSDINGKSDHDVWISGETAGGLIGMVSGGTVTINESAASTVVGDHEYDASTVTKYDSKTVGGLVGKVAGGSLELTRSYADCYLVGEKTGGLIGESNGAVTIRSSYAAGFETFKTEGAGLICGAADMENSYTVIYKHRLSENTLPYYSTAKSGSVSGKVYYSVSSSNVTESLSDESIGTLTISEMINALGTAFETDTSDSTAYNLMGQTLSTYSYPVLTVLLHYGDWDATFQAGALVYYEKYDDGTYGFYGANVESTLKNDPSLTVIGDGYGVVYRTGESNLPETVSVTVKDGETNVKTVSLSIIDGTSCQVAEYSIYPLPKDLVNTTHASEKYYLRAEIKEGSAAKKDCYYFNPHFAKTVVYLTDASASVPVLNADSMITVRTARHLYMMSLYYDTYASVTRPSTFIQERNIAYRSYDWSGYCPRTDKGFSQSPIAGADTAFQAVYDGQSNWITEVSFTTDTGLYVGFFGRNKGSIQNVVLRASYTEGSDENYYVGRSGDIENNQTVYMGVLTGRNEASGRISNCAVAGYYVAGSDGTIHAYQNSVLYAGGFAGGNLGTITSCAADTPTLRISSNYAKAYLGGFIGHNNGSVSNSYALGHVEVAFAKGGHVSIAGFAGKNSAVIRNSYCATALTASGENTSAYGFAPEGGSVTNCQYLNNGTYSYVNHMHSFNFNKGVGTSTLFSQLRVETGSSQAAKKSFDFNNTNTNSKQYPFRAVITDASGKLVHFGDWLDDENMGTVGIFYWELETEGKNNGYHFTYLGTLGTDGGEVMGGTSLCNAHDDDGVISEYGYGYFELNKGAVTSLSVSNAVINGATSFHSSSGRYNTVASEALEKQMKLTSDDGTELQYHFYAFTTRTASEAGYDGNYLCMSGSEPNSTWTLTYELATSGVSQTKQYTYTVSPFFANAMSCNDGETITASDGTKTDFSKTPGTEENSYEVRSIEQLQFINWRTDQRIYTDTTTEGSESYFPYECATEDKQKYYSQTHDIKNNAEADGTSKRFYPLGRAGRSFKEQYNGNSYQIKNIYIQESSSSYVGLFGELGGDTVLKNIIMTAEEGKGIIESQYVSRQDSDPNSYREPVVGALAGMVWVGDDQSNNITIKNCSASGYEVKYTGTIRDDKYFSRYYYRYISVGGLVGSLFSGKIENCSASNTVSINYTQNNTQNNNPNNNGTVYRQQLGGLVGTAGTTEDNSLKKRSEIINCYSGGKIIPDTDSDRESYLCGGLIGNANGRDKDDRMDGLADTKIVNCYTFCDIEKSNWKPAGGSNPGSTGEINGYYYVATNIKVFSNVSNTYYLKYDGKPQASSYAVGTGYTYAQMADVTLLRNLGGTPGNTGGVSENEAQKGLYHEVTTTEGSADVRVDGKYSYPQNSALEGKNYPFPAIIQQKDLTFSTETNPKYVYVHYGDWPIGGPYWKRGRDSMDIFQEMNTEGEYDGYATKTFYLDPNNTDIGTVTTESFDIDTSIAKVVSVTKQADGIYAVTVMAVNTGTTSVTLKGIDAVFTLEVTADINIQSTPSLVVLKEGEKENLTFTAFSIIDADHTVAKNYETDERTSWEVSADPPTLVTLKQQGTGNNKNKWTVKREDKGRTILMVTFTYRYPNTDPEKEDAVFTATTYVDVTQPDSIGLSDGSRYNMAYLGITDTTGKNTSYSVDKPFAADSDIFLYLDSETVELSKMTIEHISVNDVQAEEKTGNTYVTEDGYHVEWKDTVTEDSLYQYLQGTIYYLKDGTDPGSTEGEESVKDVALKIRISYEAQTYELSITLPEVQKR
ncbi:MAG: type II secretion system protein [Lachnospiraceae bacterium]